MPTTATASTAARPAAPYLWLLRAAVLAHAALLLFEFATAGQLVSGAFGALPLHSTGAIVLHVTAGIQFGAAVLLWWPGRGSALPGVLSAVAFALGFGQAYLGSHRILDLHVPVAMVLVALVTWVLVWSWSTSAHHNRS
ncbi:hypothetical protein F4561_003235 [Lipingzhangella halophila]|uniref:DoxX-like protein n=1 Tax=Lipingzhangella halophila TaxID=1783352 RepID=A0A7W7W460_9ACTN|nr:hypothetical protein [Lipingzhangella halophila]MBB4932415.1 hypothetical protein [Lipingzhangella halophila]